MTNRFLLILILSFLSVEVAMAQSAPSHVINAFQEKYPNAKNAGWSVGESKTYEADFESDGVAYTAFFADDGKWIRTESTLETDDLPPLIKTKLSETYDGYVVIDAELIDSNDQGRLYGLHLERDEEALFILINEDGKILRRETDEDEG